MHLAWKEKISITTLIESSKCNTFRDRCIGDNLCSCPSECERHRTLNSADYLVQNFLVGIDRSEDPGSSEMQLIVLPQ
jgi:hypothetical protein